MLEICLEDKTIKITQEEFNSIFISLEMILDTKFQNLSKKEQMNNDRFFFSLKQKLENKEHLSVNELNGVFSALKFFLTYVSDMEKSLKKDKSLYDDTNKIKLSVESAANKFRFLFSGII